MFFGQKSLKRIGFSLLALSAFVKCSTAEQLTSNAQSLNAFMSLANPQSFMDARRVPGVQSKITIASYNVENFWDNDPNNTDSPYNDYSATGSNWYSPDFAIYKAQRIAYVFEVMGYPDIVGLQEIESANNNSKCLELLKPLLTSKGYKYYSLGKQLDTPTSVTTAFVSKIPIVKEETIPFVGDNSARDPQVVTFDVSGAPVRIYNSHWKSNIGGEDQTEPDRVEIAKVIKQDIDAARAQNPALDILVLGDFNSQYNQAARMLQRTGINHELNTTGDVRHMVQSSPSSKLYNLWYDLPDEQRCSYSFNGSLNCIDQMIVADSLYDYNGLQYVQHSFKVVGKNDAAARYLLNADGSPLRWQVWRDVRSNRTNDRSETTAYYYRHTGAGFSDHLPLVAEFIVTGQNNANQKLNLINPSTVDLAPNTLHPEMSMPCNPQERILDAKAVDFEKPEIMLSCLQITEGENALLKRAGIVPYVMINNKRLALTFSHSFGENRENVKRLGNAAGRQIKRFRGRLGWWYGNVALFAESLSDVEMK